ncbi:MAG: hypothetical protein ACE365_01465 [Gammaproteobacteria bacterium]
MKPGFFENKQNQQVASQMPMSLDNFVDNQTDRSSGSSLSFHTPLQKVMSTANQTPFLVKQAMKGKSIEEWLEHNPRKAYELLQSYKNQMAGMPMPTAAKRNLEDALNLAYRKAFQPQPENQPKNAPNPYSMRMF